MTGLPWRADPLLFPSLSHTTTPLPSLSLPIVPTPLPPSLHHFKMVSFNYTDDHNLSYDDNGTTVIYNLGDMAWIIVATGLVLIMIPGE